LQIPLTKQDYGHYIYDFYRVNYYLLISSTDTLTIYIHRNCYKL